MDIKDLKAQAYDLGKELNEMQQKADEVVEKLRNLNNQIAEEEKKGKE